MTNEAKKDPFCERLNFLIGKSGDQKKVFAKNCGISEKQIFSYLNGKAKPGMKFFDGLKKYYPQMCIDWLISGQGEPLLGEKAQLDPPADIQHERVIREFKDKEYAIELNRALVSIEQTSLKEYYNLGGYIKGLAEKAGGWVPDRRERADRRQNNEPYEGEERRSGQDRRRTGTGP